MLFAPARPVILFLLSLVVVAAAPAAAGPVDSLAALQARLEAAKPGETVTMKNGRYTTTAPIVVACAGAPGRPITIAAESVGGVEIAGTHGFNVASPAAHVVIQGFKLTHASGRNMIAAGTRHVRFTRNTFQGTGDGSYLTVAGDDAQIDYNEFRDKSTVGNMIDVRGAGSQVARGLWIHHNYFHDFTNARANGAETIRFGLSGLSMSTGGGIVEHNLFVRCRGENELISNKSCGNTYRYNTFLDSPGCQLTLRHGNDCRVYGNYFRNTEGLRIFGDRHWVHSNYFEGNSIGINLGNGGAEVADGAPLTSHDRPDDCIIVFNTLVDNRTHYQMNRRTPKALGATNTMFANNLLVGGDVAVKIEGPNPGARWRTNVVWNTGATGDLPADGLVARDPLLEAGTEKPGRPRAGDLHAGEHVAAKFPSDTEPKFSTEPRKARVIPVDEVGPHARTLSQK